jgi:hypothetical protein
MGFSHEGPGAVGMFRNVRHQDLETVGMVNDAE